MNPWAELRARPHLELLWCEMPRGCVGRVEDDGRRRVIALDFRLTRIERRAALMHELVHDERLLYPPGTPPAIVQKEEACVDRITADRLVPPIVLLTLVERLAELGEPVRAVDVMEHFDVPVDVANRALYLMQIRRRP